MAQGGAYAGDQGPGGESLKLLRQNGSLRTNAGSNPVGRVIVVRQFKIASSWGMSCRDLTFPEKRIVGSVAKLVDVGEGNAKTLMRVRTPSGPRTSRSRLPIKLSIARRLTFSATVVQ